MTSSRLESKRAVRESFNSTVERRAGSSFVTKVYRADRRDAFSRYVREIRFYRACERAGIDRVARLVGGIPGYSLTMSRLDGIEVTPCDAFHAAYGGFIAALQPSSILVGYPNIAKEAAFSLDDVLLCIRHRVMLWRTHELVADSLSVAVVTTAERLARKAVGTDFGVRVLSPSDCGAHNSIQSLDGSYFFFDFEYSGLDSMLKLYLDYLLHPKNMLVDERVPLDRLRDWFGRKTTLAIPPVNIGAVRLFCFWWVVRLVSGILTEYASAQSRNVVNSSLRARIAERLHNLDRFFTLSQCDDDQLRKLIVKLHAQAANM